MLALIYMHVHGNGGVYHPIPYPVTLITYPTPQGGSMIIFVLFCFVLFFKVAAKDGVTITYIDPLPGEFKHFSTASWKLVGVGPPLVRRELRRAKYCFDLQLENRLAY